MFEVYPEAWGKLEDAVVVVALVHWTTLPAFVLDAGLPVAKGAAAVGTALGIAFVAWRRRRGVPEPWSRRLLVAVLVPLSPLVLTLGWLLDRYWWG